MATALAFCSGAAHAAPITYQGSFDSDDAIHVLTIDVAGPARLSAFTTSWAAGGFSPVLTLLGAPGGTQLNVGSSFICGDPGAGSPDAASGYCWDARFATSLQAGTYTLVLTQDGNMALGDSLADGFSNAGNADFTSQWYLGTAGGRCVNVDASQRSCDFTLVVDLVEEAANPVPEPGSLALFGAALLAGLSRRRR